MQPMIVQMPKRFEKTNIMENILKDSFAQTELRSKKEEIKQAYQEGKLTSEEAYEIFEKAKNEARGKLC